MNDYDPSTALVPVDSAPTPLNMYKEFLESDLHLSSGNEPDATYITWLEQRLWSAEPTKWESPL